jgi:hypothetical protein
MRPHKALLLSAGVMLAALVAMVVLPESPWTPVWLCCSSR